MALGGQKQSIFGPRVEEQTVSEQHVFELDRGLPVVASGTIFFELSRLVVEQHFFRLALAWSFAGDNSVGRVTQQEGILSISVQRHYARSRAAFHCARE